MVVRDHETQPGISGTSVDSKADSARRRRGLDIISTAILMGMGYAVLGMSPMSESHWWPRDGTGWALFSIWIGALGLGTLFEAMKVPALAGQLMAGVILRNGRVFVEDALTHQWRAAIRAIGLGVIMLRSGLELDVDAIKQAGLVSVRLTLLPGISEAIAVGVVGSVLFRMPFVLGLSMGFILAAVSPAVVVVGMFELHRRGYGVAKGIPSIVVAAASMDDIAAMVGFSVCIGLAAGRGSIVVNALAGPASVVIGCCYGVLAGLLCSLTCLWNSRWKLTLVTLCLGLVPMLVGELLHSHSGGALGALFTGLVSARRWAVGGWLSAGPEPHASHVVEADLGLLWNALAQPLLFGAIGSELNFHTIRPATAAVAIAVVAVGVCVRVPVAYMATTNSGLNRFERAFIALSWLPKATVQAALASVPLEVLDNEKRGEQILATAVLAILLTAPVGSFIIKLLGPKWLEMNDPTEDEDIEGSSRDKGDQADVVATWRKSPTETDMVSGNAIAQIKRASEFLAVHPIDESAVSSTTFLRAIATLNSSINALDDQFLQVCNAPVARVDKQLDVAGHFFRQVRALPRNDLDGPGPARTVLRRLSSAPVQSKEGSD